MVSGRREVSDTLADTIKILDAVSTRVFPVSEPPIPQRDAFLADVRTHALRTCLNDILIPNMPMELSLVSPWIESVKEAAEAEEAFVPPLTRRIIQPFFVAAAGQTWANSRRYVTAEAVRRLVLGGWGGWDAMEVQRDRMVTSVVEVEVEDEIDPSDKPSNGHGDRNHHLVPASTGPPGKPMATGTVHPTVADNKMDVDETVDDGWGFDGEQAPPNSIQPASRHLIDTIGNSDDQSGGEGWDFDGSAMNSHTAAVSAKPIRKPVREAKRLGKKVARARTVAEDDPWESGTESTHEGLAPESQDDERAEPPENTQADEDWNVWEEDQSLIKPKNSDVQKAVPATPRTKRKVLQAQTRVIKEKAIVSRACNQLLALAQEMLDESEQLQSMHFSSPSFVGASPTMDAAATDVFGIYRALLPVHLAPQLRGVPTLAMQLYNDCLHLSDRVTLLSSVHPGWRDGDSISRRLAGLGEHVFEVQLQLQRDEILEVLDGANGFVEMGEERAFRRCEKVVNEVRHNIERLARMLKVRKTLVAPADIPIACLADHDVSVGDGPRARFRYSAYIE